MTSNRHITGLSGIYVDHHRVHRQSHDRRIVNMRKINDMTLQYFSIRLLFINDRFVIALLSVLKMMGRTVIAYGDIPL